MKIYFALGLGLLLSACGDMEGAVDGQDEFLDQDAATEEDADESALVTRYRCVNFTCPAAGDGVLLYSKEGFTGDAFYVTSNWAHFSDRGINDRVRSFAVGVNVKVTFYRHSEYREKIGSFGPFLLRSSVSSAVKEASSIKVSRVN